MTKLCAKNSLFGNRPMPALSRIKNTVQKYLIAAGIFLTGGLVFIMQQQAPVIAKAIQNGLLICGNTVIPSLFCFMVLTNFMTATRLGEYCSLPLAPVTKYVFRVDPKIGSVILMSFLGGYPIGPKAIAQLLQKGQISLKTANRLLCFCCNAAPAFVITAVGAGMLHHWQTGVLLYSAQVIAGAAIGVLLAVGEKSEHCSPKHKEKTPWSTAFVDSVNFSTMALLQMCGFILLFQAVVAVSSQLLGHSPLTLFLFGLMEVTTGCLTIAQQNGAWVLPSIAFFLSFGGCSVIFQILSLLKGTGIDGARFFFFRIVHGALSFGICAVLMKIFPQAAAAANNFSSPAPVANSNTPFITMCMVGMCSILLLNCKSSQGVASKNKYRR